MLDLFLLLLNIRQLLLELRDSLALLSVAILRPIPMNLLAGFAAVAVGLASLAQLARGGVQWDAAHCTDLSKGTKDLLNARQMDRLNRLLSIGQPGRQMHPEFCLCESIQPETTVH